MAKASLTKSTFDFLGGLSGVGLMGGIATLNVTGAFINPVSVFTISIVLILAAGIIMFLLQMTKGKTWMQALFPAIVAMIFVSLPFAFIAIIIAAAALIKQFEGGLG